MKYKVELTYKKDIDKSIRYDQNAKSFNKYMTFYVITDTAYHPKATTQTTNENIIDVEYITDLNDIYNRISNLFRSYDIDVDNNVLFLDESFDIKVSLLLKFNVTENILFSNLDSLFIYEIYDNTLQSIEPV